MTPDTLQHIYLPIDLPKKYWKAQIQGRNGAAISTSTLAELIALHDGTSDAVDIDVNPSGNLSSNNVQDALEELQADIDGLTSGTIPTYTKTFGNVTTDTINSGEHGLSTVHNVIIKTASNDVVSVRLNISGTTIIINSNVSLLNHKLLIY